MPDREATFKHAFGRIFFSRTFWIFALFFVICAPMPTLFEYLDRLSDVGTPRRGRGTQYMLEYAFLFLAGIWLALCVLVPYWHNKIKVATDPLFRSYKRMLLHDLFLFSVIGCLLSCFYIFPYILSAGIFTPIYANARITPLWLHASYPYFTILTVAFFNILSYVALSVLISSLFKRASVAIFVNFLLVVFSFNLYPYFRVMWPAGMTITPAMQEHADRLAFWGRFIPGSLSVNVTKQIVFNWTLAIKMIHASLLFTATVILLAFLVACVKDHLAHRRAKS